MPRRSPKPGESLAIGGVFRTHTSVRGLDSKATVASKLSVSGDVLRGGPARHEAAVEPAHPVQDCTGIGSCL